MKGPFETYVSGSYDITSGITVNMDWKGATLSKYPYYTNNLVDPSSNIESQIKKLQSYQSESDGKTDSTYVASCMKTQPNIDSPTNRADSKENFNNLHGLTTMNPYVSH